MIIGMDGSSGKVVSNVNKSYAFIIKTFSFDKQTGKVFAIVETENANKTAFETHFGMVDLETLAFTKVGDGVNMYRTRGYTQINTGICVSANRMYFASMFKVNATTREARLFLVGTNLDTGKIECEYARPGEGMSANFVDLAFVDGAHSA